MMKDKKLRITKCRECIHLWFRGLDMQGNTYIAGSPAAPNSCRVCAYTGNVVEDIDKIDSGCPLEDYGVCRKKSLMRYKNGG
jgi:hypothetical protein